MSFFLVSFLCVSTSFSFKKLDSQVDFGHVLHSIRNNDPRFFFQFVSYELLQDFSVIVRTEAKKYKVSPVDYLLGKNKIYRKALVLSVMKGLLNKDPEVRLYCVHLLLNIGLHLSWIETSIAQLLDRENEYTETTADNYYFKNIYGYWHYSSLKDGLINLLRAPKELVVIYPSFNEPIYRNAHLHFEWSRFPQAGFYELYVDDVLYYSGQENRVLIRRQFSYGKHELLVIAQNRWKKSLYSVKSGFLIKRLQPPILSIQKTSNNDSKNLIFTWDNIHGATSYILHVQKNDSQQQKIVYKTTQTQAILPVPIPKGVYIFRVQALNSFQKALSEGVCVESFGDSEPFVKVLF